MSYLRRTFYGLSSGVRNEYFVPILSLLYTLPIADSNDIHFIMIIYL